MDFPRLDAATTRAALPFPALIEALRRAFVAGATVPSRHVYHPGRGTLLLMPAWRPGGRLGIKTVSVFAGNAALGLPTLHSTYLLFDATTGAPLALLDGDEITTRRTVAASALAASFLARDDASTLLVVGAGRVAAQLAEAMRCVRPIDTVWVWARRVEAAAQLAAELRSRGFAAAVAAELEAAVQGADIVGCATLATAPLVRGAWLRPGVHLDLIGSFTPAMRESDDECFTRARVYVDSEEALQKSGDVLEAVRSGRFAPADACGTLTTLCRGEVEGRVSAAEITLFKSVGTALEDLAAAELAFDGGASPAPAASLS